MYNKDFQAELEAKSWFINNGVAKAYVTHKAEPAMNR